MEIFKNISIIVIITLCKNSISYSQEIDRNSYFHNEEYAKKIKQIDEFINIFNNKIDYFENGKPINYKLSTEERKPLLKNLFNKSNEDWNFRVCLKI